jgi:nucleotide-binding universal stress UspA family protein
MKGYKNILVHLNLSECDPVTLKYASIIVNLSQSKHTYFVHIAESWQLDRNLIDEYPEIQKDAEEEAINKIKKTVNAHFEGCPTSDPAEFHIYGAVCTMDSDYEAVEGKTIDELLKFIVEKEIDLVITSYDADNENSETLTQKLARKSPCSILAIPDCSTGDFKNILVPIDFSKHSKAAIEAAIVFASAHNIPGIKTVSTYQVPAGFHKTGKSYEEFGEIMKKNTKKLFDDFIKDIDTKGVKITDLYKLNKNTANGIIETIKEEKIDFVVIGSRGKNASATILLGSIPGKLLTKTDVPMLIVKLKGEGLNFLQALLEI